MSPSTNQLDQTLMALADPTRRAILTRLTRGDTRVTDLARPFAMSLNAVSKHIRVLERARLVSRRRNGREHVLSFNPTPLDEATAWMNQQQAFWTSRLDALDTLLTGEDRQGTPRRRRRKRKARAQRARRKLDRSNPNRLSQR